MLDENIQSLLKPNRRNYRNVVVPMIAAVIPSLVAGYVYFIQPEGLDDQELGKLVVLAAESLSENPNGIWVLMEDHVGKRYEKFNADDSVRAVKYLVSRIDAGTLKKENDSSGRLDF